MSEFSRQISKPPPEQEAIRARCFHTSGSFVEFPREDVERSIPERFEKIVRMYPNRPAVSTRSHSLTYDELNKAANQVAHAVRVQRGDAREPIAVLLEHDVPAVIANMGVLKAGKFYLVLDSSYPRERLKEILEDSHVKLLVTNNKNLSLASALTQNNLQYINVDELNADFPSENLCVSISPCDIACIPYTSGSTGTPKGVLHSHRYVMHKVMVWTNDFQICKDDRLTLLHSFSSNASDRHLFGSLLNGATLFPFDLRLNGVTGLPAYLRREDITIFHSIPSIFRSLTHAVTGNDNFPLLRLIILGGEPLYKRDFDLYRKHFGPAGIFVNNLGSNETGSIAKYFMDKYTKLTDDVVPVGYTSCDKEVLLLDESGREVDTNCIGEIVVKSEYIASGYWGKARLTQSAFACDPQGSRDRIFHTGDLGRMRAGNCLVQLGRKDSRVKVRGNRVEIADVEGALLEHPGINEATVVTRGDNYGDLQLIAYVIRSRHPGPTVGELRRFLSEKLHNYMIPSRFVVLNAMPRLPMGKVDRNALPAPANTRPELDTPYFAPKTIVEQELARIWAEVLSVGQIGTHDNFFDLGGHSLAASRVISRIIKEFQLELPIKALFDSPTVAEMAAVINENQGKKLSGNELEKMLADLESLSEEEAKMYLSESSSPVVNKE